MVSVASVPEIIHLNDILASGIKKALENRNNKWAVRLDMLEVEFNSEKRKREDIIRQKGKAERKVLDP